MELKLSFFKLELANNKLKVVNYRKTRIVERKEIEKKEDKKLAIEKLMINFDYERTEQGIKNYFEQLNNFGINKLKLVKITILSRFGQDNYFFDFDDKKIKKLVAQIVA